MYSAFLLPLLFTAGMTIADTTDDVTMLGAYGWAFVKPIRKHDEIKVIPASPQAA